MQKMSEESEMDLTVSGVSTILAETEDHNMDTDAQQSTPGELSGGISDGASLPPPDTHPAVLESDPGNYKELLLALDVEFVDPGMLDRIRSDGLNMIDPHLRLLILGCMERDASYTVPPSWLETFGGMMKGIVEDGAFREACKVANQEILDQPYAGSLNCFLICKSTPNAQPPQLGLVQPQAVATPTFAGGAPEDELARVEDIRMQNESIRLSSEFPRTQEVLSNKPESDLFAVPKVQRQVSTSDKKSRVPKGVLESPTSDTGSSRPSSRGSNRSRDRKESPSSRESSGSRKRKMKKPDKTPRKDSRERPITIKPLVEVKTEPLDDFGQLPDLGNINKSLFDPDSEPEYLPTGPMKDLENVSAEWPVDMKDPYENALNGFVFGRPAFFKQCCRSENQMTCPPDRDFEDLSDDEEWFRIKVSDTSVNVIYSDLIGDLANMSPKYYSRDESTKIQYAAKSYHTQNNPKCPFAICSDPKSETKHTDFGIRWSTRNRFARHLVEVHMHHHPHYFCANNGKSNRNCPEGYNTSRRGDMVRHLVGVAHKFSLEKARKCVVDLHYNLIGRYLDREKAVFDGMRTTNSQHLNISLKEGGKLQACFQSSFWRHRMHMVAKHYDQVRHWRGDVVDPNHQRVSSKVIRPPSSAAGASSDVKCYPGLEVRDRATKENRAPASVGSDHRQPTTVWASPPSNPAMSDTEFPLLTGIVAIQKRSSGRSLTIEPQEPVVGSHVRSTARAAQVHDPRPDLVMKALQSDLPLMNLSPNVASLRGATMETSPIRPQLAGAHLGSPATKASRLGGSGDTSPMNLSPAGHVDMSPATAPMKSGKSDTPARFTVESPATKQVKVSNTGISGRLSALAGMTPVPVPMKGPEGSRTMPDAAAVNLKEGVSAVIASAQSEIMKIIDAEKGKVQAHHSLLLLDQHAEEIKKLNASWGAKLSAESRRSDKVRLELELERKKADKNRIALEKEESKFYKIFGFSPSEWDGEYASILTSIKPDWEVQDGDSLLASTTKDEDSPEHQLL